MSCDYMALATAGVRGLHPYQPGKPIDELERELGIRDIVKLASNENPLGPSAKAIEAIQKALPTLTRYPDGNGFILKQALAQRYGVGISQITLGNGSNDLLEIIARAFCDATGAVLYSQYGFAVYPIVTQAIGARAIEVPAREWGHDLEAMASAITPDTRVIFIANPNNPTGTWVTRSELALFLSRVPESVLVVLDEAYGEYIDHPDFPDGVEMLTRFSNVIVTRTFSKAWGLAALRVGYSVSHPQVAEVLNRVRQPFNVDSLAMVAATAVLGDDDYLRRSREMNAQGLAQLTEGLTSRGYGVIPSVANFITFDTGGDAAAIYQQLLRQGVIVRPVGSYGLHSWLRVSVGLPAENARFLTALDVVRRGD